MAKKAKATPKSIEARARAVTARFRRMTNKEFDEYVKLVNRGPRNARERARLDGDREAFRWLNEHTSMEKCV